MKTSTPFFSVVIPRYNNDPHVGRALRSVFNQSYQDFEILIIDDASTDGSLEAVYNFHDTRIRIFKRSSPGSGGYATRNLGISEVRGQWIALLDADDSWRPDHL